MRRFLQLNPYDFVNFLKTQRCHTAKMQGGFTSVWNPGQPDVVILLRMGEPVQRDVISGVLESLEIPEASLERYLSRPRRDPPR